MSEQSFVKDNYGKGFINKLLKQPYHESTTKHMRDLAHIRQLIDIPEGYRILDMGSGSGITSCFLSKCGFKVTGVDISKDMIEAAEARNWRELTNAKFRIGTFEDFKDDKHFYYTILFYDCLHHSLDKEKALKNAYDNLAPEGTLIMFEPNIAHTWMNGIDKYGRREEGKYKYCWIRLLKKAGFRDIETFFVYDRIYKKGIFSIIEMVLRFFYQLTPLDFSSRVILRCRK